MPVSEVLVESLVVVFPQLWLLLRLVAELPPPSPSKNPTSAEKATFTSRLVPSFF
jgi:hypothetical protein